MEKQNVLIKLNHHRLKAGGLLRPSKSADAGLPPKKLK
jgi:hypothetical protein